MHIKYAPSSRSKSGDVHTQAGLLASGSLHLHLPERHTFQWIASRLLPGYSGGTAPDLRLMRFTGLPYSPLSGT
jgi:hypothetical protein